MNFIQQTDKEDSDLINTYHINKVVKGGYTGIRGIEYFTLDFILPGNEEVSWLYKNKAERDFDFNRIKNL